MPPGSKMDPKLAKADQISNGGSTCVIRYLENGEKTAVQQQRRW